jgi:hypothetical protein
LLPARALPSPRTHWRNPRRIRRRASGRSVYNYLRDFDPTIGRCIESDTIAGAGGRLRDAFICRRQPINEYDPLGLASCGFACGPRLWTMCACPPSDLYQWMKPNLGFSRGVTGSLAEADSGKRFGTSPTSQVAAGSVTAMVGEGYLAENVEPVHMQLHFTYLPSASGGFAGRMNQCAKGSCSACSWFPVSPA